MYCTPLTIRRGLYRVFSDRKGNSELRENISYTQKQNKTPAEEGLQLRPFVTTMVYQRLIPTYSETAGKLTCSFNDAICDT